ncbi:MAG: hypothetical protein R2867_33960 [Caldilineaceae bacterium]
MISRLCVSLGNEPASHDFNFDLYCGGETELFAGLMRFNTDYEPVPYVASYTVSDDDGTVYAPLPFAPGQTWTMAIRSRRRF